MLVLLLALVIFFGGCFLAWKLVRRRRDREFLYSAQSERASDVVALEGTERFVHLAEQGFQVASQGPAGVTMIRSFRPWWLIFPIVLIFPVGLLFLLYKQVDTVTLTVTGRPDASVTVTGVGPKSLEAWAAESVDEIATGTPAITQPTE